MDRPDLLRQLAEVAVDMNASPPSRSAVEQLTAVCATARVVFGAAAVSVATATVRARLARTHPHLVDT